MNRHSQYKRERLPQIICYTNSRILFLYYAQKKPYFVRFPARHGFHLKKSHQTAVPNNFCRSYSQKLSYSALSVPLSIARSMTSPNSSKQTSLFTHSVPLPKFYTFKSREERERILYRNFVNVGMEVKEMIKDVLNKRGAK